MPDKHEHGETWLPEKISANELSRQYTRHVACRLSYQGAWWGGCQKWDTGIESATGNTLGVRWWCVDDYDKAELWPNQTDKAWSWDRIHATGVYHISTHCKDTYNARIPRVLDLGPSNLVVSIAFIEKQAWRHSICSWSLGWCNCTRACKRQTRIPGVTWSSISFKRQV